MAGWWEVSILAQPTGGLLFGLVPTGWLFGIARCCPAGLGHQTFQHAH